MKFITIILAIAPLLAIAAPIKSSHQTVRKTDYSQAQFPAATLPYSIHRRQTENTGAGDEDEEIIPSGTGVLSGVVPVPTDPPEAGGQQQQAEAGPAEPEQAKTQTKSCANGSTKVQQGEDAAPPKNGMQAEAGEAKPQAPEGGDEVPAPAPKGQKQAKAESPAPEGEGEDTPPKGQKEAEGEPPAPEGEGGVVPPKGQKQEDPTAEAPEEEGEAAPPKGNKQAEVKPQAPGEEGEAPPPKGNDKPDAEPKEPEDPKDDQGADPNAPFQTVICQPCPPGKVCKADCIPYTVTITPGAGAPGPTVSGKSAKTPQDAETEEEEG